MTHVLQAVLKLYRKSWLHANLAQTCYSLTRPGEFEHSVPVLTRVIEIEIVSKVAHARFRIRVWAPAPYLTEHL